ncbi:hypothetical protein A1O1_02046 [Capronia coronata CBS 617.96]|uniref:Spindle pole body component n=1 Tax=Capronia coronata CBS 617.96 TaxID=1182541 RepID=W9ZGM1_9EURO|nr:uncharacterized protein A1O1_02046 [Capronia coronata CBS 617.96]EXJ93654.1 hypothetical protein A1O1_02046 [Capronia coronata CBS 617.96]
MNGWMEELALTFLPLNSKPPDLRKHTDAFIRKVKTHPYGRTDQFAVADKLAGLEEKLLVLNLDDVAEELYSGRIELSRHNEHWIPDVLDLLLHLSYEPAKYSRVENLQKLRPRPETPPPLTWAEVEEDDPVDHHDQIWQIPDYGDLSSDDDEILLSSTKTSPVSVQKREASVGVDRILDASEDDRGGIALVDLKAAQFWRDLESEQIVYVDEKQAVREVLFMLGGFPTAMFTFSDGGIRLTPTYQIRHLESSASHALMSTATALGSSIDRVRRWVNTPQDVPVMQLIQVGIGNVLADFERALSEVEYDILHETSRTGIISLLQILQTVRKDSNCLVTLGTVTQDLPQNDSIRSLDALYNQLDKAYSACDSAAFETLLPIFISALKLYAKPLDIWLHTGTLDPSAPFFIDANKGTRHGATLWHNWFAISRESEKQVPICLRPFAERILATGKTAAFLQHLGRPNISHGEASLGLTPAVKESLHMIDGSQMPFSITFETVLGRHLDALLARTTRALKELLEGHCGLTRLLDAFDYLYFGVNGAMLDGVEARLFDRIDRCLEMWNDHFLVGDLLAEACRDVHCVDADLIAVHSVRTSSRSMASRRRSVKILGAMTVSYHVSWPLANIVLPASMTSYQRIGLLLAQIRRAIFVLQHRAYFCVQHTLFGMDMNQDENDRKRARAVHAMLLQFVNVVYAHLTTCTITPLTSTMRVALTSASAATGTVDDMIAIHTAYIRALEHACLASDRIKPLRESLLAILDLCIRFTDLVTSPGTAATVHSGDGSGDMDFEASSFISARRHRRRRRQHRNSNVNAQRRMESSSSDDDDGMHEDDDGDAGEGYSTFMLDDDSSMMEEIGKVREAFVKHASFLIAGLRAVARSSGQVGDGFELLADSLDGSIPPTGIGKGTLRRDDL